MATKPTTTCLITNYNGSDYLAEAVEGVLAQTVPVDEIVLVDDGSDDGSIDTVRAIAERSRKIRLLEKSNGGQLSAFNEGFRTSTGDILFFLDSDDVYEPEHVREVLRVLQQEPTRDFVFCGHRRFGRESSLELLSPADIDFGYTVVYTLTTGRWIGAPTSCLAIRRGVLERFLPLPFESDWRTRADDCLVFGASIVGARKFFLARPLVRYRVHGGNSHYGKTHDAVSIYRRKLAINQLFAHLTRRMGYDRDRLSQFAHRELRTAERPDWRRVRGHISAVTHSTLHYSRRISLVLDMLKYYLIDSRGGRRSSRSRTQPEDSSVPRLEA